MINECHRGGARDESTWREILEYFKPAVQLGLTATPKRKDNVDTYAYFGEPVYTYSLKEGINDMTMTTFWHPDWTPMSAQEFLEQLFDTLPDFFQSEAELRAIWSAPDTRANLLQGLAEKDFGPDKLAAMQQLIEAEKSDLFDVLAYVAYLF